MPRRTRLAAALWLFLAFVIWNVVIDLHVRAGQNEYVRRAAFYEQGRGPRASMDAVMTGAVSEGVRAATGWAALVAGAGLGAVGAAAHLDAKRARARRPGS
jgi:hypothetical protein